MSEDRAAGPAGGPRGRRRDRGSTGDGARRGVRARLGAIVMVGGVLMLLVVDVAPKPGPPPAQPPAQAASLLGGLGGLVGGVLGGVTGALAKLLGSVTVITGAGGAAPPLLLQILGENQSGAPMLSTGSPSGYAPATMKKHIGLSGTGAGQTIAIVDAYGDPTITSDLAKFDSTFGLSAPPSFKVVNETGGASLPAANAGWALEMSLDVEWAHAMAPSASILLVEATSSSLNDLFSSVDYAGKQAGVSVISNSWGTAGELSSETTLDTNCKLSTAVCVFSTGDSGHPGGYPAYSPYVVAVGGTSLTLATSGSGAVSVTSETAWSDSGGGVSAYEAKPSFQSKVNATGRAIPDVSYDADPATGVAVYDSTPYNGASGWFQMGGTSAGAPQWSAIIASADQLRKAKGKAVLAGWSASSSSNHTDSDLYTLASGLADVTSGTNGTCGAICTAAVGYDDVTGLGSPRPGIDTALANAT